LRSIDAVQATQTTSTSGTRMREPPDELWLAEPRPVGLRPSSTNELVDVADGDIVLHYTYRYLEAHSLPPSDDEVHSVTAAIAQYKGPQVVSWATLESFLAGVLVAQRT
jgi:hypothetical protein